MAACGYCLLQQAWGMLLATASLGEVPWQGEVPQQGEVSAAGGRCPQQGDVREPGGDCRGSLVVGGVCRGNHQGVRGSLAEGAAASLGEVLQQGEVSVAGGGVHGTLRRVPHQPGGDCHDSLAVGGVCCCSLGVLVATSLVDVACCGKTGGGCHGSLEVVAMAACGGLLLQAWWMLLAMASLGEVACRGRLLVGRVCQGSLVVACSLLQATTCIRTYILDLVLKTSSKGN